MKVILVAITALIIGCSTSQPLYDSYSDYSEKTHNSNIIELAPQYFSDNILEEGYETLSYMPDFLLFKKSMKQQHSHFEKSKNQKGCLVVNGFNDKNEKVIFSLEYVKPSEKWLINFIAAIYDEKEFSKKALCPNEFAAD